MLGQTSAKFGSTFPLYTVSNIPSLGFNAYYNSGWKFGAGSTAQYGGVIDFNQTSGNMNFYTSSTTGAADGAATMTARLTVLQAGSIGFGTSSPTTVLADTLTAQVSGATNPNFSIENTTAAQTWDIFVGNTGTFGLRDDNGAVNLLTITPAGAVALDGGVTGGTTTMDIAAGATQWAVCHSTQTGTDNQAIVDCNAGPTADYAEMYPVETDVEAGDIVTIGTELVNTYDLDDNGNVDWNKVKGQTVRLKKSTDPYQPTIIGIASDNYGQFSSTGYNIKDEDNPKSVALTGRVNVKVAPNSPDLQPGDYVTSSTFPGRATKSTQAGFVIGRVLEPWTAGSGKDQVMVFIGIGFNDPDLALNNEGNVILTGTSPDTYTVATPTGTTSKIGAFASATVAKLQAGLANIKDLFADRATITHLQTSDISPVASDSAVTIHGELAADKLSAASISSPLAQLTTLEAQTITAETATISGTTQLGSLLTTTASVSGQLTTTSLGALNIQTDSFNANEATISAITGGSARLSYLESKVAQLESAHVDSFTAMTATISGTLYADNIADFDQKVANTFRQPSLLATLLNQNPGSIPDLPIASGSGTVASSAAQLRHTLADLDPSDDDIIINPTALFVKRYFEVTGDSYLAGSVGIGSTLVIGDGLRLSGNELAYAPTQGGPVVFKIQPSGVGKLELLAVINGDLRVAGAFTSDGDVTTKGDIQLVGPAGATAATISSAGAINTTGSITSTSSISGTVATFSNLKLGSEQLTATGSGTVDTTKPTGRAKLSATQTEITLKSELITPQTLIYITPIGSTNNQVLYVKSQTPENPNTLAKEGEFKIGVDQPLAQDIEFTWWLVN
jgi:hypothetical protein